MFSFVHEIYLMLMILILLIMNIFSSVILLDSTICIPKLGYFKFQNRTILGEIS